MKNKIKFLDKWLGWYLSMCLWLCYFMIIVLDIPFALEVTLFGVLSILATLAYLFWINKLITDVKNIVLKELEEKKWN